MGQIVGWAAKPKRCNLNKLSQLGTPAAGEYILVSSDNSMNAAGQGNFDCYIVGDGRMAAAELPLKNISRIDMRIFDEVSYISAQDGNAIVITDDNDNQVAIIDETGADFSELKKQGVSVVATDKIKDEVEDAFSGKAIIVENDNGEEIVRVDEDGLHATEVYVAGNPLSEVVGGIDISLPDTLYAVVGDTLQVFFRGCIIALNPYQYDILVTCPKGNQYPRYFEYTPTAQDVGSVDFKIQVKSNTGGVIAEKTCTLVTKNTTSPSARKNVLCFGDSLTTDGVWPAEAYRRLAGSGGTPQGLGYTNVHFCGKKQLNGAGYYGVGGWKWDSYTTAGTPAFRFQVSGVSSLSMGAVYTNNGHSYTIIEINVTDGSGNILCSASAASQTPTSSGTLTKSSGNGDATINFSSYTADSQNPLWDYDNNKMTFVDYANRYCDGQIDYVYVLLTWNGLAPRKTDFSDIIANARIFANTLHSEFPNAKMKVMGVEIPSLNGGIGANYGAIGVGYADEYGMVLTAFNMNKAYQDFANETAFSSFVEFVNVSAEFDTEYNMKYENKAVNTRNSAITEMVGTNGVHPANSGYLQIADVVFRNLIAEFS